MFLNVDPEVIDYIYGTTNYRDHFNSLLDEQGIQFDWTAGSNLAVIKYNGDDKEERLKTVQSFLETFGKFDISVKKDIWDVALPEIFRYCSRQADDPPTVQILGDKLTVRVISSNSDIAYHKKCLKTILLKLSKEATFDRHHIPNYSKEYITLLKKISFVEKNLKLKCKDVQVDFDEENLNVGLKGPKDQLEIASQEFLEQELAVSQYAKHLELPQTVLKVLNTIKGKEAINKVLEHHILQSVIEFTRRSCNSEDLSAKVLGNSDEHVEKAVIQISQIATEEKLHVDEDSVALKSTPEWSELCKTIIAETGVLIQNDDLGDISVIGFTEDVRTSIKKLQLFLEKNSIRKEPVICPLEDIKQYIKENKEEDLRSIERKLVKYDVKILDGERNQFYISGRGEGLRQSKALLSEIINMIAVRNFTVQQPGLRKTFERGKGESLIKMVGKDQKCLIRIKKKFQQKKSGGRNETTWSAATETDTDSDDDNSDLMTSVGEPCFVTAQGYKISWKIGNIAEEQVCLISSKSSR